ncbi:ABC transporter ATP-binding protein [Candidatus Enterococcus courvalinii]|uniref:ABC transporter ATP-binding protein n=1 Tax=Candidatus Enterococcus courvalinii TaxID=2815329 RepID=A0ABS3HYR7_9ENTE|nr:ABC transporter ATP-binding protein [Enterococcus sp. MSG2901]MBO0481570.1 ABC transporter ATP-binding protein [Enterococcus sp. MSG2901]
MLEVTDLVKTFGDYTAVDHVSFRIPDGKIMGLIGQNGAGKTTTFRLILDFLTQDQGEILWNGKPLGEKEYDIIGYLPEERGLYPKVTIQDQLIYFAELRGKTRKEIEPKIDFWMEKFQVKGKKTDKVKSLSKGNQQKVQLIATLIHEPKLIILDEPFSGLDPVNAELLKDGILELKAKGSCVIFSSHNMDNVEKICDHLIMLRNGKMVLNGKVHEIRESFGRTKLFLESDLTQAEVAGVEGVQKVVKREDDSLEITLSDPEAGKEIFTRATQFGYIPMFNQQPPTLEEIFKLKAGEFDA